MTTRTFIIYRTPWWQRGRWQGLALAAVAIGVAIAGWPDEPPARASAPPVRPVQAAQVRHAATSAPAVPDATSAAVASPVALPEVETQKPLSTMVAPGVHVTPLSVPAGTSPQPAGPRPEDSEPEN